jgi:tRNA-2-methylthio-N6-dimethylallyladenosine synthase
MRFHVTTFGCQMNLHDSERMRGMLASLGYEEAESRDSADLILFNTCSIRESADSRFIAHLGEAKRLPLRRRRLRAGADPQAGRVPQLRLAQRPGLL